MRLIDIIIRSPTHGTWPGDTAFHFGVCRAHGDGRVVQRRQIHEWHPQRHTHGTLRFTTNECRPFDRSLDLALLIGPARVFLAAGTMTITRETFAGLDARATPRVLVRTNHCDDKTIFPARIPVLAPDVPAWLGAQGVNVIGLDLPSVDQVDDPSMQVHHRLDAANILILENLDLRAAAPGVYELIRVAAKDRGRGGLADSRGVAGRVKGVECGDVSPLSKAASARPHSKIGGRSALLFPSIVEATPRFRRGVAGTAALGVLDERRAERIFGVRPREAALKSGDTSPHSTPFNSSATPRESRALRARDL